MSVCPCFISISHISLILFLLICFHTLTSFSFSHAENKRSALPFDLFASTVQSFPHTVKEYICLIHQALVAGDMGMMEYFYPSLCVTFCKRELNLVQTV